MARRGERAQPRARWAGVGVALTPSGRLVVRSANKEIAPEGSVLSDPSGRHEGRVLRVFGPVARPYLSLRLRTTPSPREAAALLGARWSLREG